MVKHLSQVTKRSFFGWQFFNMERCNFLRVLGIVEKRLSFFGFALGCRYRSFSQMVLNVLQLGFDQFNTGTLVFLRIHTLNVGSNSSKNVSQRFKSSSGLPLLMIDSMIIFSRTLAILLLSTGAFAQVMPTAVTDAAGFTNRVAPGSLASIFGENIATKNMNAGSIPLPFSLGGVQVTVDGIRALLVYTGVTPFNQVNFQMPGEVPPGTANLVITVYGVRSAPFPVNVASTAPGRRPRCSI
jgi:hypothetical protein